MKTNNLRKIFIVNLLFAFLANSIFSHVLYAAQELFMPKPGTMVTLSNAYTPALIKGLKVNLQKPMEFDFILDTGHSKLEANDARLKEEGNRLIKFFLAGLTIPEKDLWVNLSPYEKDRITSDALSKTEMGREMLAQDYLLKQVSASMIHPEKQLGKEFWAKIYEQANQQFGTSEIPLNTLNKVWIMPDVADIYEHKNSVYIAKSRLKVLLEDDYLALKKTGTKDKASNQIVREIVLPALEKEINEGKNFAPLRQIYHSLILAAWYKKALKNAFLNQVYANQSKVRGVHTNKEQYTEEIYQKYLQAFKKGAFNIIKDEIDEVSKTPVPRKYFSGGEVWNVDSVMRIIKESPSQAMVAPSGQLMSIKSQASPIKRNNISWERVGVLDIKFGAAREFRLDQYPELARIRVKVSDDRKSVDYLERARDILYFQGEPIDRQGVQTPYYSIVKSGNGYVIRPSTRGPWQDRVISAAFLKRKNTPNADRAQRTSEGVFIQRFSMIKDLNDFYAMLQVEEIEKNNKLNKATIMILPTGGTAEGIHDAFVALVQEKNLDLSRLIIFNMDEYFVGKSFGVWKNHPQSYFSYMEKRIYAPLAPYGLKEENVYIPNGDAEDKDQEAQDYEKKMAEVIAKNGGKVHLAIGGIGGNGHVAFNESVIEVTEDVFTNPEWKQKLYNYNEFSISGFDNRTHLLRALVYVLNVHWMERQFGDPKLRHLVNQKVTFYIEDLDDDLLAYLNKSLRLSLKFPGVGQADVEFLPKQSLSTMRTRAVQLSIPTIKDNSRFYNSIEEVPTEAITIGIGNILDAEAVYIAATGPKKAEAVRRATTEPSLLEVPASYLRPINGNRIYFVTDMDAAKGISQLFDNAAMTSLDPQWKDIDKWGSLTFGKILGLEGYDEFFNKFDLLSEKELAKKLRAFMETERSWFDSLFLSLNLRSQEKELWGSFVHEVAQNRDFYAKALETVYMPAREQKPRDKRNTYYLNWTSACEWIALIRTANRWKTTPGALNVLDSAEQFTFTRNKHNFAVTDLMRLSPRRAAEVAIKEAGLSLEDVAHIFAMPHYSGSTPNSQIGDEQQKGVDLLTNSSFDVFKANFGINIELKENRGSIHFWRNGNTFVIKLQLKTPKAKWKELAKNIRREIDKEAQKESSSANVDPAQLHGGIDFNLKNIPARSSSSNEKIEFDLDPALITQLRRGNYDGLSPVIIKVARIDNLAAWLP